MEARLPEEKLCELRNLLQGFMSQHTVTLRELASLMGKLSFTSRVVVPGRTFMRRLWDLIAKYNRANAKPHYRISLTEECRQDLAWWNQLLNTWNGKSFFLHNAWTPANDLGLFTDASGSWGWGAYYGSKERWVYGNGYNHREMNLLNIKNCLQFLQLVPHGDQIDFKAYLPAL